MSHPDLLIIGAGMGGLSVGCYAQMSGYRTQILEMHDRPGGLCTAWTRAGYVFDGCMHNLAGTSPDSRFHEMWRELGVIPRVQMRGFAELVRIERPDGEPFTVYTDLDRLEAHMRALSPADGERIREFVEAARFFQTFDLMGLTLARPLERARALIEAGPMLLKWGSQTLESYAAGFQDPFLRAALPKIIYDWPRQSMLMALPYLGRTSVGDFGWPVGGSQALAGAVADRYVELGGEITYGAKAAEILVSDNRAVGVRLTDGRELHADAVVSNANGRATIFDLLGGRYVTPGIRAYYDAPEDRIEMGLQVSLGVARNLAAEPHAIVLPLPHPQVIDGEARDRLYVEPFAFDPTLAPPGKAPMKVMLGTSYARWAALAQDPQAYHEAKAKVLEQVLAALEARFPGLSGQVEATDVATPVTTERFTGNGVGYKVDIPDLTLAMLAGKRRSQTLPGLHGFYMVGQWAGAPSVPMAAAMGRDVVRQICRRDGRPFHVEAPAAARAA